MARSEAQQRLIDEALDVLESFGIPIGEMTPRRREKTAVSFLTLAGMRPGKRWQDAANVDKVSLRTRDMIEYMNAHLGERRSAGSYDDVRRGDLKPLVLAGIVVRSKPDAAQNNPSRGYGLSADHCAVARSYGTRAWKVRVKDLVQRKGTLEDMIDSKRVDKIPIDVPDKDRVYLSLGRHSELHKKIMDDMLPAFCGGSEVLYIGDTARRKVLLEAKKLRELGIDFGRGLIPDIVAYSRSKNVLYLIEAVYSSNPFSPHRKLEMSNRTSGCKADVVFISAFHDKKDFKRFAGEIAWGTEAWIASEPDHMIHFNGDKFMGASASK